MIFYIYFSMDNKDSGFELILSDFDAVAIDWQPFHVNKRKYFLPLFLSN